MQNHAVSEVVGVILVLGIISSVVSATLVWGIPYMDDKKVIARADSAINQFDKLDEALQDMISQGVNSSRIVNFVTEEGYVHLGSGGTRFVIFYPLKIQSTQTFSFNVLGFNDDSSDPDNKKFSIEVIGGYKTTSVAISYLYNSSLNEEISGVISFSESDTITTNHSLVDAVKIDIKNNTNCVGRIWIFDLGFITYEISSNRIAREIIFENGAVVSSNPFFSYSYLTNEPENHFFGEYYHLSGEKYSLIMRIIQLKPDSEITIGPGKANYKFIMKLNNSYIRENKVDQGSSKQVKIQVFGDHAVAWNNYLKDKYGFSKFDTNTLSCYLIGFSLIHSICNIDLEII